jgi:hypothetical protein
MKKLPLEDQRLLDAAEGWIGLGDPQSASDELKQIAPKWRKHPDVLLCQIHLHAHRQEWETCIEIAGRLVKLEPDCPEGWIHRSYALHELKRTQEAFDQLLPAAGKFTDQWVIPYNLACYTCQLGQNIDAWNWLKQAVSLDKSVKRAATDDPDLQPLWKSLGISWDTL